MGLEYCFAFLVIVGAAFAYTGDFVPKSFYVIDETGHKSDVFIIRNKRDLEELPILRRMRRGGGSASSYSSSSASAGGGGGGGGGGYGSGYSGGLGGGSGFVPGGGDFHDIASGLNAIAAGIANAAGGFGGGGLGGGLGHGGSGGGSGASSYSTSYSSGGGSGSGYGGSHGTGGSYGSGGGYGGSGGSSGHSSGGPQIFSRFGEDKGTGVHISSSASGPNGAFSSSSSSIDSQGNIKYATRSGKY